MSDIAAGKSGDHPTLLVRDREGHDLLCFLEHLIPLDGLDYALLSPVAVSYTHLTLPTKA